MRIQTIEGAFAALVLAGVAGCAPSTPPEETTVSISGLVGEDGALHFASAEEFFKTIDAVDQMDEDQLDAWERSIGFESMRRSFRELRRLEAADPEERAKFLAINEDIAHLEKDVLTRRVPANAYAALIDRRGILYVDGIAHWVTATHVLTSRHGDLSKPKEWRAIPYIIDDNAPTNEPSMSLNQVCGATMSGEKSTSDRRVKYKTRIFLVTSSTVEGDFFRYRLEWEFWGYKKVLGVWIAYSTTYQMYNVGIELDLLRALSFDGIHTQYDYQRIDDYFVPYHDWGPDETSYGKAGYFVGDSVQNPEVDVLLPSFIKFHQETTSRGTYPTRGIMECNYCGDGTCQPQVGEAASSCRSDCGYCTDGVCYGSETPSSCYSDCHCGDGYCDPSIENSGNCSDCYGSCTSQVEPCPELSEQSPI